MASVYKYMKNSVSTANLAPLPCHSIPQQQLAGCSNCEDVPRLTSLHLTVTRHGEVRAIGRA